MRQHKTSYSASLGIFLFLLCGTVITLFKQQLSSEKQNGQISTNPNRHTEATLSPNNSTPYSPTSIPQKQPDLPTVSNTSADNTNTHHFSDVQNTTPLQLLNLGRQLARQGDAQTLQQIFGKALLRHLQQDVQAILPLLLAVLNDPLENTLLRTTICLYENIFLVVSLRVPSLL